MLEKNKIGKIYSIEGEYNYGRIEKIKKGWRGKIPFYSVVQGGGIHIIDLMNWMTKSYPDKVISLGNNLVTKNTNFKFNDNNIALLKFKNGVIGKVTSNFSCMMPHNHYLKVYGEKGTIEIRLNKIFLFKSRDKKNKPIIIKYQKNNGYKKDLLNFFLKNLKKNRRIIDPSLNDIYSSMSTCLAIDKSIKSKSWEKVK